MKNKILLIVLLISTLQGYSQIGSSFNKGFNDGFKETLNDSNITGNYNELADPRKCNSQKTYTNDPKAKQKLYSDGYRCGVKQAYLAISKIEKNESSNANSTNLNFTSNINDNNRIAKQAIRNANNLPDTQRAAKIAQINTQLQRANNRVRANNSANRSKKNNQYNNSKSELRQIQNQKKAHLNRLKQRQTSSYNLYNKTINELNNSMQQLRKGMQEAAYRNIQKELERRRQVTNKFYKKNTRRINNITRIYNDIPLEAFRKKISGTFKGNLLIEKKYSFSNGQKILTEIPVLVDVESNQVKEIYKYGMSGFAISFPDKYPDQSFLKNGIVEYNNYETLEKVTLVLTKPYLTSNSGKNELNEDETGYIIVYARRKKDDGKKIFIQELDVSGEIVREVDTKLTHVRRKKYLEDSNIKKIPINTGNKILYFSRPTNTRYGKLPLYLKVSKSDQKPLKNGEIRYVKIKKYREL